MDRTSDLLQVRLLGGFELRSGHGRDAPPLGRKVRALLACLALSPGKPWPREKLMALLWSDRGEEQARASLRQALAELRRVLGEPSPLRAEHDTVSLDPAMVALDAVEFERLAKAGRLDEAAALYRGPLLDGHGVRDDAFEEWLGVERSQLHDLAVDALDRLGASQSGDVAMKTAHRLLQLDPAREETHRLLMRLYAAAGQRAQALRQYQQCCDALQRELQAKPDIETERLYRQIQDEAMPAARVGPATPDATPALGSKPSIAVLPFRNLSGDPDQQYFSDGITEDIITELSRYRPLFVIARNSSFQFRGPGVDIGEVHRRLGVRYVLEGSVRMAGNTIRVTAQLIDAKTGAHIWAERYDRAAGEVFDIQDEVVRTIVGTLIGRLEDAVMSQSRRKPTQSLAAYDSCLRAFEEFWRLYSDTKAYFRDGVGQAVQLCEQALRLDPSYARAHACLAVINMLHFWHRGRAEAIGQALDCAGTAVSLDENDSFCRHLLGLTLLNKADYDLAELHLRRAVALNPNDPLPLCSLAEFLIHTGQPQAAVEWIERSMQLDPLHRALQFELLGKVQYLTHRFEEAAASFRQIGLQAGSFGAFLAAALAQAGQIDAARAEMAEYIQRAAEIAASTASNEPVLELLKAAIIASLQIHKNPADAELWLDGLRKAGLKV